jgi:hypothetical protein
MRRRDHDRGERTIWWRRARVGAAVVAATLVCHGTAASADPATPTDYRSTITAVTPDLPWLDVSVVGGDSFLELHAEPGHAVTVLGYSGEPYLRVLADGTTQVNRRSPAVGINRTRYGSSPDPGSDASAPPEWTALPANERAGPSTLVWHDHRTHWMGGSTPPPTGPGGLVEDWHVSLDADGIAVDVAGTLHRHHPPSGWWWSPAIVGVVVLLVGSGVGVGPGVGVVAAALLAIVATDLFSLPDPARPAYTPLALLGAAVAAAVVALVGRRRWWASAFVAGAGAAAALAAWMLRASVTRRFVPGPVPDRLVGIVVVLAGSLGVVAFARGVFASAFGSPTVGVGRLPTDTDRSEPER